MVLRAVQMAVWQGSGSSEVILHSDRGGQFKSELLHLRLMPPLQFLRHFLQADCMGRQQH